MLDDDAALVQGGRHRQADVSRSAVDGQSDSLELRSDSGELEQCRRSHAEQKLLQTRPNVCHIFGPQEERFQGVMTRPRPPSF